MKVTSLNAAKKIPALHWPNRLASEGSVLLRSTSVPQVFWSFCAEFIPIWTLPTLRAAYYRLAGCEIGPRVSILGRIELMGWGQTSRRLHIGEGSIIAPQARFGLDSDITLGRNVSIGPHATLYTATHPLGFGSRRMSLEKTPKPIVVGDGAWVGMHSLILPGVTLGQGCVVSAGSVVSQDVAPNTLVAGNPAVVQQTLPFGSR